MTEISAVSTTAVELLDNEEQRVDSRDQNSLDRSENQITDTKQVNLMRQVAELAGKVLETLQQFSQNARKSTESLKFTIKTNTKGAAEQLEAKGKMTSGSGFVALAVTVISSTLVSDDHRAIAKVFAENMPRYVDIFNTKYDGNSMVLNMKARIAEQDLQNKSNVQQAQGSTKQTVEQMISEACRNHSNIASAR